MKFDNNILNGAIDACLRAHEHVREVLASQGVTIDEWDFDHSNLEIRMWVPAFDEDDAARDQETWLCYGFGGGKLHGHGLLGTLDKVNVAPPGVVTEKRSTLPDRTVLYANADENGVWKIEPLNTAKQIVPPGTGLDAI